MVFWVNPLPFLVSRLRRSRYRDARLQMITISAATAAPSRTNGAASATRRSNVFIVVKL